MRTLLITAQAAIITFIAVIGAQSDTNGAHHCPLPQPQAEQSCNL